MIKTRNSLLQLISRFDPCVFLCIQLFSGNLMIPFKALIELNSVSRKQAEAEKNVPFLILHLMQHLRSTLAALIGGNLAKIVRNKTLH